MLRPSRLLIASFCMLCLATVSPVRVETMRLQEGQFIPAAIQGNLVWQPIFSADMDGDGQVELLQLDQRHVVIHASGGRVWNSPPAWQVTQAFMADLNHDGTIEAAILVWRPFSPWPVDRYIPHGGRISDFHNANGDSCHIILIKLAEGHFREAWAGSALAEPVLQMAPADLNGDGAAELVTLQGSYAAGMDGPAEQLTAWEWNGFGFSVLSRTTGPFKKLSISNGTGHPAFITTERVN